MRPNDKTGPYIEMNGTAVLKVVSIEKNCAFLNCGGEKLLLPLKEQTRKLCVGDDVLVAMFADKNDRPRATMRVYSYLKSNPPHSIGDMLPARVYNVNPKYGVFIAIEDTYSGLIPKKESQGDYNVGDKLIVRVVNIREDGRVDASPNQKTYLQIGSDSEMILKKINEYGGVLPFDDHASPALIQQEFHISKAAFKRAVGHLLKQGKITLRNGEIAALNIGAYSR